MRNTESMVPIAIYALSGKYMEAAEVPTKDKITDFAGHFTFSPRRNKLSGLILDRYGRHRIKGEYFPEERKLIWNELNTSPAPICYELEKGAPEGSSPQLIKPDLNLWIGRYSTTLASGKVVSKLAECTVALTTMIRPDPLGSDELTGSSTLNHQ